jgi:hypothetical protein
MFHPMFPGEHGVEHCQKERRLANWWRKAWYRNKFYAHVAQTKLPDWTIWIWGIILYYIHCIVSEHYIHCIVSEHYTLHYQGTLYTLHYQGTLCHTCRFYFCGGSQSSGGARLCHILVLRGRLTRGQQSMTRVEGYENGLYHSCGSKFSLWTRTKWFFESASNSRLRYLAPKWFLELYSAPNYFWS